MKRNYIVKNVGIVKDKRYPNPICDACNKELTPDPSTGISEVNIVVLNSRIWGIVCEESSKLLEEQIKNIYHYNSCDGDIPEVVSAIQRLQQDYANLTPLGDNNEE